MFRQCLPWLVCAAVLALPAPAFAQTGPTPSATVNAGDNFFQDAAGPVGDSVVNIAPGQSVTFRSPVAANNVAVHQVDFEGTKPSVCNQTVKTADPILGPAIPLDTDGVAPIPGFAQPPGWEGYCTFTTAGTYQFVCPVH